MASEKIKLAPMQSLAFGSVGAAYTAIGTPTSVPIQEVVFQSSLNQDVLISDDGVTDKIYVRAGQSFPFISAGLLDGQREVAVPKGTQYFVKQATLAPASGQLSMMGIFVESIGGLT